MWACLVAAALATGVATPAAAQTAADPSSNTAVKHVTLMPDKAALDQPVASSGPPSDFWSARTALITAGIGAAALASYMAWRDDRDLGKRKAAILALPPTAIDQWNSQFTAAQNVERSRNFWRSVAMGVGGVTAGYWVTTALEDVSPRLGGPFSVNLPKKGWAMHFDPFNRQVALAGSF
jgi:hypothetical protein